jgi:serine/threonine protein kinase
VLPALREAYDLGNELGRGGLGVVYAATRREDGRPSAVKLCLDTGVPEDRARVLREAELLRRVAHPRLAGFQGIFHEDPDRLALVYDLVDGEDLRERLSQGPAEFEDVLTWVSDVAGALEAIHAAGLLHRDVKVENVVVGGDGRATLLDFGLIRSEDEGGTVTKTGVIVGTPAYIAPEVFQGIRPGQAADLYALGCMAYELLAARVPFPGTPAQVYQAHLEEREPPPLEELPPGRARLLENFFSAALAKDPEDRFETPGELAEELAYSLREPIPDAPAVPETTQEHTQARATWQRRLSPRERREEPAPPLGRETVEGREPPPPEGPRTASRLALGSLLLPVLGLLLGVGTGRWLGSGEQPPRDPAPPPRASFPLQAGCSTAILAELEAATFDRDPLRGPQTLRTLPSARAFEAWLDEGGDPEDVPEAVRAELVAVAPSFQAQGVPSPFHPWLHVQPLVEPAAIGPRVRTEAVRHGIQADLPERLGGWTGRALVALEAVLARTAEQEAELTANPGGPYPGGLELPRARLVFRLGRIDMGRFLHRVNEERAHRIAVAPWLAQGVRLTRELLLATGRALEAEPATRALLASLVAGPMGTYKGYFASGLASDDFEYILGAPPRRPEAWLVAAAILHEQSRIEKELRGIAGESREREPELWERGSRVEGDSASARHCQGLGMHRQVEILRELQDPVRLLEFWNEFRRRRLELRPMERVRIEVELAHCATALSPLLALSLEERASLAASIEAGLGFLGGGSAGEAAPALVTRLRLAGDQNAPARVPASSAPEP